MSKLRRNIIPAVAIVGLAVSLVLLYQARASLHERDEQVQRLRQRMAQLEDALARHSPTHPTGLTAKELEAYLSLTYREFDVIYGSGHRRFRDQPRDPAQVAALIEAYLNRHPDLPFDSRATLQSHAAQMFAIGGMNERAITFLDQLLAQNPADGWAAATKCFLLFDRAGLLASRRKASCEVARFVDLMIDHFGESYYDASMWEPIGSAVSVSADVSAKHRATAEQLAKAFGLPVTVSQEAQADSKNPAECIRLEIRPMGTVRAVPGYIIFHLKGNTTITATDENWLAEAVKRFIGTSRQHKGKRQAPIGLATSYDLAR